MLVGVGACLCCMVLYMLEDVPMFVSRNVELEGAIAVLVSRLNRWLCAFRVLVSAREAEEAVDLYQVEGRGGITTRPLHYLFCVVDYLLFCK